MDSRNAAVSAAPLRLAGTILLSALLALAAPVSAQVASGPGGSGAEDPDAVLDEIFASWNSASSPGCAVGIEGTGAGAPAEPILRSWGMAELEHGIANTPATIFEAGSVSKQFTAAAVVLLELDGVLSLDDEVRRWIPELPEYADEFGRPVTLRQMMNHTSGLRDWGAVASIGGWGRSDRSHTHDHVLEIAARQRTLNYPPGDAYSYSNTGYNLLAVVVERASGVPFARFSEERIFGPLGLEDTQWRDDYRRIVPGRSGAYQWRGGTWVIDRPIEHVHGNGGLLTTVADLLRWNRVLDAAARGEAAGDAMGGEAFARRMVEQAVLTDGSTISYAGGLFVDTFEGRPIVSHTGATSGYRAYLARFPEDGLSVALLCNTGNANPGQLGGRVARAFLAPREVAEAPDDEGEASADAAATSASDAAAAPAAAPAPRPDPRDYAGSYRSDEAETTWMIEVEGENVILVRRPGTRTRLVPATSSPSSPSEPDTFQGAGSTIRFHRDASGRVVELGVSQARVWDLRFERMGG
jgi:CubicO group peptidase (beta-lactamase class C family)